LGNLTILLVCSDPSDALIAYDVAQKLHKAMWRQDIESRLQYDNGFKYLPAKEVGHLQLRKLGCKTTAILIREEYTFTLNTLEERQKRGHTGGVVVTGHPGIGTHLF
jgi:hypothetical protein